MNRPAANQSRFDFAVAGMESDLRVIAFDGTEAISRLFEVNLELASENANILLADVIGLRGLLSVQGRNSAPRLINGIVSRFEMTGRLGRFCCYRAVLVPYLWLFRHRQGSRIFQHLRVDEIIAQVLKDAGVPVDEFRFLLNGKHPTREYCVQYRESELDFMCRLMEEEGIFFYFEHLPDHHRLVMSDDKIVHPRISEPTTVPYLPDTNMADEQDSIRILHSASQITPGRVTLRCFDYRKPTHELEVAAHPKTPHCAIEEGLELYDFPGEYDQDAAGEFLARVRLQEQRTPGMSISGDGDCDRLIPGNLFEIEFHPRDEVNREYLLTSLRYAARQPQVLEESASGANISYDNHFEAVPFSTDYRPPRLTRRPSVEGSQTAFIVGPPGEEIYVDQYGRVKVQFHWDRYGQRNEKSSCWVRVNQTFAGGGWGSINIPRIGQEVIVDFIEGDPDRPIITGRVYNGASLPPFKLPDQANVMGMKSNTVKGSGYNEISFNDTAGKEHFKMHAQYDQSSVVRHDKQESIGRHSTLKVAQNQSESIGENRSVNIGIGRSQSIGANDTLAVAANRSQSIGANDALTVAANRNKTVGILENALAGILRTQTTGIADFKTTGLIDTSATGVARINATGVFDTHLVGVSQTTLVGATYSVSALGNAVIEAPEIVLKAGGSIIRLDGSGVCIEGADVWINCGKCGGGGSGGGGGGGAGGAGSGGAGSSGATTGGDAGGGAAGGAGGAAGTGFFPPPGSKEFDLGAMLKDVVDSIPGIPRGVGDVLESIANGDLPELTDILKSIPPSVIGRNGQEILDGLQAVYGQFTQASSPSRVPGIGAGGSSTGTDRRPSAATNPNDPHILYASPETGNASDTPIAPGSGESDDPTVLEARQHLDSEAWAYDADRPPYPPDTNKCNLFVYEILNESGKPVPMNERWSWSNMANVRYPPLAGQWADPSAEIPGWKIVVDPQPGDVAAIAHNYSDASGHVAIVSGPNTSISVIGGRKIEENDWGFRSGQNPTFRRYTDSNDSRNQN